MPGDGLLHPLAILAIGVLVFNDHVLKQAWPGVVTGKLSDISGLVFFPLLLQAAVEVGAAAARRSVVASQRVLIGAIVATGAVFTAIKLVPAAGDAYRLGLGWLQWLASVALAAVGGRDPGQPHAVTLTADPTDLAALLVLVVPYLIGRRRARQWRQWSTTS